ncbi:v-type ATP synthase subunit I [Striga asiatica]|uniref:V-type ATP synthase subunit I n=1 Tax=Striga asiatica TaxID=4170 RepID=A0A5A7PLB1_STRAF|nr:v-type ATP synthase subunit I [Striga asiatica]
MQASVDPQSSPSSVKVSTALSISSQNKTPTPDVELVDPSPADIGKATLMELEIAEPSPIILQIEQKPTGPAKTWKRLRNKSGRLLREPVIPIVIDNVSGLKRTSAECELPSSSKVSKILKQGVLEKPQEDSEKVGVASLEWHASGQC